MGAFSITWCAVSQKVHTNGDIMGGLEGSCTYYVAAEGGEGVWDLQLLQRRGEGGLGVCNVALLIRLDFDFDKLSNLVVTVITF